MQSQHDKQLDSVFAELREADARRTPPFAELWHHAGQQLVVPRANPWPRYATLGAAALLLLTVRAMVLWHLPGDAPREDQPSRRVVAADALELDFQVLADLVAERTGNAMSTAWQSPTQILLQPQWEEIVLDPTMWDIESQQNL